MKFQISIPIIITLFLFISCEYSTVIRIIHKKTDTLNNKNFFDKKWDSHKINNIYIYPKFIIHSTKINYFQFLIAGLAKQANGLHVKLNSYSLSNSNKNLIIKKIINKTLNFEKLTWDDWGNDTFLAGEDIFDYTDLNVKPEDKLILNIDVSVIANGKVIRKNLLYELDVIEETHVISRQ